MIYLNLVVVAYEFYYLDIDLAFHMELDRVFDLDLDLEEFHPLELPLDHLAFHLGLDLVLRDIVYYILDYNYYIHNFVLDMIVVVDIVEVVVDIGLDIVVGIVVVVDTAVEKDTVVVVDNYDDDDYLLDDCVVDLVVDFDIVLEAVFVVDNFVLQIVMIHSLQVMVVSLDRMHRMMENLDYLMDYYLYF